METCADEPVTPSLSDLQSYHAEGYRQWCLTGDKPLEVGTFNDYFNAVARYGTTLCLPKDISGFYSENEIPLPEKVQKGAARLFRYLKGVLRPDTETERICDSLCCLCY